MKTTEMNRAQQLGTLKAKIGIRIIELNSKIKTFQEFPSYIEEVEALRAHQIEWMKEEVEKLKEMLQAIGEEF